MKILYFAPVRFPSERAHSIQAVEMCQAFGERGNDVTLVVPKDRVNKTTDVSEYYALQQKFKVARIGRPLSTFNITLGSYLHTILFSIFVLLYIARHRDFDVIYAKDERVIYFVSFFTQKIAWEPHVGDLDFIGKRLTKKASVIIALTEGVQNAFLKDGVPKEKIMVAHDAVRLDMFKVEKDKALLRQELGLPVDKKIVMYTGHLFAWKGVDVLAEAAAYLDGDTVCVFIGGLPHDIKDFSLRYKDSKNIFVLGNKPRIDIPKYLAAADILVLPNSGNTEISRTYTSPLKLFEYMASKRPIVASSLPSLKEVLDEDNAFLVPSDDPQALAEAISAVSVEDSRVSKKIEKAYVLVSTCTWYNRAEKITNFIEAHA